MQKWLETFSLIFTKLNQMYVNLSKCNISKTKISITLTVDTDISCASWKCEIILGKGHKVSDAIENLPWQPISMIWCIAFWDHSYEFFITEYQRWAEASERASACFMTCIWCIMLSLSLSLVNIECWTSYLES